MDLIFFYFIGVLLLSALSLLVIANFLRYRFRGDKTLTFVVIFTLLFSATVAQTLLLVPFVPGGF